MLRQISIPNSSLTLSSMALGNAAFGPGLSSQATDGLYAKFREAGGTCFDTAHCYSFWIPGGDGSGERLLGACIRRHADRQNVAIITKGGHPAVLPDYPRPDAFLSPERIAQDIAESLERLATDHIDLYLLHRDDRRVPVGEIIDGLNGHITAGRLCAIGASNWAIERLVAANAYAQAHGLRGFVASQPQFNLACPNAPQPTTDPAMRFLCDSDLAWHRHTGLPVVCYSPTGQGYFASGGQRARESFDNPTSRERLARAGQLAEKLGATANQIALAYLLCEKFPIIPILGTSDPAHLAEALGAAEVSLTPSQVQWLRNGNAP